MKELFNLNQLINIQIFPKIDVTNDVKIRYKIGDIIKRKIKLFGITIRKEKRSTDNWIQYSPWYGQSVILNEDDLEQEYHIYKKDECFYRKAYVILYFNDDVCRKYYFLEDNDMYEFLIYLKNIKKDLLIDIDIFQNCYDS